MYPDLRPPSSRRCFSSPVIEEVIRQQTARIKDRELAWLFGNCFPNTLDTTVDFSRDSDGKPDGYVITGDIDAMWLRDSTGQVWPYLPFMRDDPALRDLIAGVIRRQTRNVLLDPYANAFYKDESHVSEWASDQTEMRPGVHERKYELDSLCAILRLAAGYHAHTGDLTPFDSEWLRAVRLILETIEAQQEGVSDDPPYRFSRSCTTATETLMLKGLGQPARRCGMSKSPFRPSDDAAVLPYLVPANALAVVSLRHIAGILPLLPQDASLASRAEKLAAEIDAGIRAHAIVRHHEFGDILAYEVDGYGSHYLMDDANLPSLLSLPYLGYISGDDPLYRQTRAFILSEHNPYYFTGKAGHGVGGPHIGLGYIWPMSIISQALSSASEDEIVACLSQLKRTHAGTGFMHESFWKEDAANFTRSWFAWVNSLFGELVLQVEKKPPRPARAHPVLAAPTQFRSPTTASGSALVPGQAIPCRAWRNWKVRGRKRSPGYHRR